jgi:hypothetical protein
MFSFCLSLCISPHLSRWLSLSISVSKLKNPSHQVKQRLTRSTSKRKRSEGSLQGNDKETQDQVPSLVIIMSRPQLIGYADILKKSHRSVATAIRALQQKHPLTNQEYMPPVLVVNSDYQQFHSAQDVFGGKNEPHHFVANQNGEVVYAMCVSRVSSTFRICVV